MSLKENNNNKRTICLNDPMEYTMVEQTSTMVNHIHYDHYITKMLAQSRIF